MFSLCFFDFFFVDVKFVIVMNTSNVEDLNTIKAKPILVRNVIFQQEKLKIYRCQVKRKFY